MSDTKLTIEKKAELYDKIMEQRQQVIGYLYELIDGFHSLELNDFGLDKEDVAKLTDKNNSHYAIFKEHCYDRIVDALKGFKRAELMDATCENWPIENVCRPYNVGPFSKIKKTKRWLVQKLLLFFNDFHIGRADYPGADLGVYEGYVQSLIYIALNSIGIEHDDKSLLEFINENLPEDGNVIGDDERDDWNCKASVLLSDIVVAFDKFRKAEHAPENVKAFAEKFDEIRRRAIADKIVPESYIEADNGCDLPKLADIPLEFKVITHVVPDDEDCSKIFFVADVSKPDSGSDKEDDAIVKAWGEKSGLKLIESNFDFTTKTEHWMLRSEIRNP